MGGVINDAQDYNATLQASQLDAKKKQKSSEALDSSKSAKFSKMMKTETDNIEFQENVTSNEIPEIAGMSFEKAEEFLIDEVYAKGDLLKKSPLQENFILYKKAVQNFLKFVQSQSYEVEDKFLVRKVKVPGHLKPVSRQKCYKLVKVVNEKLDSLASDILYNQRDQIRMTAKVEEIKGLLIDVFY